MQNCRRLSYVSTEDLEEPLTLSHLIGSRLVLSCPTIDPGDVDVASVQRDGVLKRLAHLDLLLKHFWSSWMSEHLLKLRNAHRTATQYRKGIYINVGYVVVVHEEGVQCGQWKLALVEEVITGHGGKIRAAQIKTSSTTGRVSRLRRLIRKLYPVELCDSTRPVSPTTAASQPSTRTSPAEVAAADTVSSWPNDRHHSEPLLTVDIW